MANISGNFFLKNFLGDKIIYRFSSKLLNEIMPIPIFVKSSFINLKNKQ